MAVKAETEPTTGITSDASAWLNAVKRVQRAKKNTTPDKIESVTTDNVGVLTLYIDGMDNSGNGIEIKPKKNTKTERADNILTKNA